MKTTSTNTTPKNFSYIITIPHRSATADGPRPDEGALAAPVLTYENFFSNLPNLGKLI